MGNMRLQLTWYNKDKALIPIENGKYGYAWVDPSDPRYCETHTLCLDEYVRERLPHLKKLLSPDGSIWVHLDNVENHRMRLLLDEVFGVGNFVTEVVWQKADSPRNDARFFSYDHDVILVYCKSAAFKVNGLPRTAADNARFSNPDQDPKGPWWDGDATAPNAKTHQGMVYAIQHPMTGELIYPGIGRHWIFDQQKMYDIMSGWTAYKLEIIDDDQKRADVCGVIDSPVLGKIPPLSLSGGVKTLILVLFEPGKIFNASTCGDNCAKWLLRIASSEDRTVNLRHIMDFGRTPFEIRVLNTDQIVHSMKEFTEIAINYV